MVTIGNRVAIADRATLVVSSNANFSRIRKLIGEVHRPIVIEDDAWLGEGVIVLPSVTIGRGSVVGAGAVVRCPIFYGCSGGSGSTCQEVGLERPNVGLG